MAFKESNKIFATGDTGRRAFVTVDWKAVGKDELKAGTPLNEAGRVANDATAIGIVANDSKKAYDSRVLVVVSGYIDLDAAQKNSGIVLSAACKSALVNIVFTGAGARGVTSWNDLKDRPFYTGDPVKTEIIPATTVTFSEQDGQTAAAWPESFDLVDGQTYYVSWDGTDYVCTGILFNGDAPVLGNLGLIGAGDDTGEPFIFLNQGQWLVGSSESATEHVIAISEYAAQIVTLDEKYLPKASENGYGVVKMSGIVSVYNFPDRVAHDQMVDAIAAFEAGNASIMWNGLKVISASYDSSADTISVNFAEKPLETITCANIDGLYVETIGSTTYGEVQGSQVRIVNGNNNYVVLSVEGESDNITLEVGADRISFGGTCGISETEIFLYSSTEGSRKLFKITVDDDGTLSATAVT